MATNSTISAAIPAFVLIAAGIVSGLLYAFVFVDSTTDDDWASAGAYVLEKVADTDLIRVHPTWATGPLVHVADRGTQVDVVSRPLAEDFHGVSTIWLMTDASREAEALAELPFETSPKRHEFDSVTLLEIENPVGTLPFVFHKQLATAKVTRHRASGQVEECKTWNRREERWDCGRRDRWVYVGRTLREVGDEPRECIWAHPLAGGDWLHVTFPDVPPGRLVLKAGQTLRGQRSPRGTDITTVIEVDGERVFDERISHRDQTYHTVEVPKSDSSRSVTFKLSAGSMRDRFFCIDGFVFDE